MHPKKVVFVEGVNLIFNLWQALTLAVRNEWGGPESKEKKAWMVDVIVEEFDKRGLKVEVYDLEDLLAGMMSDEFETNLEDDSAYMVAKDLHKLYNEIRNDNATFLNKLREAVQKPITQTFNPQESESEEDEEDEEDGDEEMLE